MRKLNAIEQDLILCIKRNIQIFNQDITLRHNRYENIIYNEYREYIKYIDFDYDFMNLMKETIIEYNYYSNIKIYKYMYKELHEKIRRIKIEKLKNNIK